VARYTWERVKNSKTLSHRLGALIMAIGLMSTSVIFGIGFWSERIDADNFAQDDFETNVEMLQTHEAELMSSLEILRPTLQELADYSSQMAKLEYRVGGTFPGSPPGPGRRMQLRKSDNTTLSMYRSRIETLIDSVGHRGLRLRHLAVHFRPEDVTSAKLSLGSLRTDLNSYAGSPVFSGLTEFLSDRIKLGRAGLTYKGSKKLNVNDIGFESRARLVLGAIGQIPENVELIRIFNPGGVESVRLVLNSTLEGLTQALSFRRPTHQELNADRRNKLREIQSGGTTASDPEYTVDRLAVALGWLIDILIAISVFVTPTWPKLHSYGEPQICRFATVIRSMVGGSQTLALINVSDPDLLRSFVGADISGEIHSYIRRDPGGCTIEVLESDDSATGIAMTRLASLATFLPGGSELFFEQGFAAIRRTFGHWNRIIGRDYRYRIRVGTDLGKAHWTIIERLQDADFWNAIAEITGDGEIIPAPTKPLEAAAKG